jgi:hypothetical protein
MTPTRVCTKLRRVQLFVLQPVVRQFLTRIVCESANYERLRTAAMQYFSLCANLFCQLDKVAWLVTARLVSKIVFLVFYEAQNVQVWYPSV